MKLLVIILCVLSERYLVHVISYYRFQWFDNWSGAISKHLPEHPFFANPFVALILCVLPILLVVWAVCALLGGWFFGLVGFLINLLVFYYCLGPDNPFYPVAEPVADQEDIDQETLAGQYFIAVHSQLFAPIFWFITTGILGVLAYRLFYLCKKDEFTQPAALLLTGIMDWVSLRITVLLYLFAGNFQRGIHFYGQQFFSSPENNEGLLSTGGLLAARTHEEEQITLTTAQSLMEHALIVYLVFLAFFTMAAWL